jgi:hypothetical protein
MSSRAPSLLVAGAFTTAIASGLDKRVETLLVDQSLR